MNYLVLGGAGFIGSHVVDALIAAGHRVRVFERPACELDNLAAVLDKIELCYGDFANVEDRSVRNGRFQVTVCFCLQQFVRFWQSV